VVYNQRTLQPEFEAQQSDLQSENEIGTPTTQVLSGVVVSPSLHSKKNSLVIPQELFICVDKEFDFVPKTPNELTRAKIAVQRNVNSPV